MSDKTINDLINQLKFFDKSEKIITHKPIYEYTAIFTNKGIYLMSDNQYDLSITLFTDIVINPNKEVLCVDNTLYFECLKNKQTYSIEKTGELNELRLIKYCEGYLVLQAENTRLREALEKIQNYDRENAISYLHSIKCFIGKDTYNDFEIINILATQALQAKGGE